MARIYPMEIFSLILLEAIHLPAQVAVIKCKGHMNSDNHVARGNSLADKVAKEATQLPRVILLHLIQ